MKTLPNDPLLVNPHQTFCVQKRVTSDVTQKCFGLTWEETAHQAHHHTVAVQSWLSSRAPQGAIFEGKGISATSTGLQEGLLNLAHDARFPSETPPEVVDEEIEAIKAFFRNRGVPFIWWLSPFAAPPHMDEHLPRHGFHLLEYHLPALVAPLSTFDNGPSFDPEIQVWQANSLADLHAASTIRRIAFRFPEGVARTYFEAMAEDWLCGAPARLFVARVGNAGPPVGIGALIMGAGLPGVYVMATLPAWEGRGLGKALLRRILQTARDEGHAKIVLTAGARAYSLYQKFGFEHLYEYRLYAIS
jgi:GNAT superfamily N-acetyltransferase